MGKTDAKWKYVLQMSDTHFLGGARIWSTLDYGRLFLLTDGNGEFELYYQGR